MSRLLLLPGPRLLRRNEHPGDGPAGAEADVTESAHEYLFDPLELDPAFTLGDLFRLLARCEDLQRVFRRDFAAELCAEARKGPVPPRRGSDPPEVGGIEYLELYRNWQLNTGDSTYSWVDHLDLHGVGKVLAVDAPDHGRKAGERIQWAVSLTPLREMLVLPLRFNPTLKVIEDDLDTLAYGDTLARARCAELCLGQFVHAVLWELSFHGAPADQAAVVAELTERKAELDTGTPRYVSGDDLFAELDRPGFDTLFETLADVPPSQVRRAIRDLADDAPAAAHLAQVFGGRVIVRPAFRALAGRAFRKAFRTAGDAEP
ncbi:MAG: hypothetical protein QM772_02880 [Ottowia sp.]|uniref:hypothetical protein n=1 Tax=Ottowia sp. TaxID=1898956 RepID=UPI0039E30BF1